MEALFDRGVDILSSEFLARSTEHGDLLNLRAECALHASKIRHEHRVSDALDLIDTCEDFGRVGELRHGFRGDERSRLYHLQPSSGKLVNQTDFGSKRHVRFLILEAITWANFNNFDCWREH